MSSRPASTSSRPGDPEVQGMLAEMRELEGRLDLLRHRVLRRGSREVDGHDRLALLACSVGDQTFAVAVGAVEQVVLMAKLAPLPEPAPWVAGLLDLHGESLPVLDLHARLTHTPHVPEADHLIVVCKSAARRVGWIVHEVVGVVDVETTAVQAPPSDLSEASYVIGVFNDRGRPVNVVGVEDLIAFCDVRAESTVCPREGEEKTP